MKKTIIFVSLFILLGATYYFQPTAYEILKLKTFDSLVTDKQPSGNFVILNINESDNILEKEISKPIENGDYLRKEHIKW